METSKSWDVKEQQHSWEEAWSWEVAEPQAGKWLSDYVQGSHRGEAAKGRTAARREQLPSLSWNHESGLQGNPRKHWLNLQGISGILSLSTVTIKPDVPQKLDFTQLSPF